MKIKPEPLELPFSSDGFSLHGILHLPKDPHPPFVVGSHGLMSSSESSKQIRLGEELSTAGIAFFRFDHRGCGKSDGLLKDVTSLGSRINDLLSAVRTLCSRKGIGKFLGVFGSSMGGAVCLAAASMIHIPSMAILAAPVKSRGISRSGEQSHNPNAAPDWFDASHLQFDLTSQLFRVKNVLILHGDDDEVVPFSNARLIYKNTGKPKRLVRFTGGDHVISNPLHQNELIQETTGWFIRAARDFLK
ncbi:MAG: alpha/beta fold hydrolase [Thermodesulfobacteriota bacterium]